MEDGIQKATIINNIVAPENNSVIHLGIRVENDDYSKLVFGQLGRRDMRRILKKIKIKDLIDIFKVGIAFIPAVIYRNISKRKIWVVTERENEAKDNGIWFYRYACENAEVDVYYAIKKKSNDYEKVKSVGRVLEFGSIKHYIYTLCSSKYISSQFSCGLPGRIIYYMWLIGIIKLNFYFLQHGVTQNRSSYLEEPAAKVKLFCCVSDREADFARSVLGYSNIASQTLGFCRYDGLTDERENSLFVMLTWRKYLSNLCDNDFKKTDFFFAIQQLLNNKGFIVNTKKYKVNFVLHPGIAKYQHLFHSDAKNIEFINIESISFQEQISTASIFITDYSSIAFDFAYLNKPVIYYQFDKKEFREKHFQEGYFDYVVDGFGPVCEDVESVVEALKDITNSLEKYTINRNSFFKYKDTNNCKRVFDFISNN